MSRNYLFSKVGIHEVMEHQRVQISNAVQSLQSNSILSTPVEDLVERLVEQFRLDIPTIDRSAAHADQREGPVQVIDQWSRDYGGRGAIATVQGTIVTLHVPYNGDKEVFYIRPSRYDSMPPVATIGNGEMTIIVSGRNLGPDGVKNELNRTLDSIENYLSWHREGVAEFNRNLPQSIRSQLEARKAKLLADQSLVANLGFPLRARPDAPKTYAAPVKRKTINPRTTARPSNIPFKPEPALDEKQYSDILDIMHSMTTVMERSPSAFVAMGEEDLRQHYLVQLNGHFDGAASGETFNFQGKTDILIRVDGRNIFIAECKFWTGPKGFIETVDQLLGYLSWRDTKAAIVIFNRNKDFTAMLTAMLKAADEHPQKKRGPVKESETRFRYVFANPHDADREVTITVMAFDVPNPQPVKHDIQLKLTDRNSSYAGV